MATFLDREMGLPTGLFQAALDADSEGEEGRYYLFTAEDMKAALGKNEPQVLAFLGIGTHGLWEQGKSNPQALLTPAEFGEKLHLPRFPETYQEARTKLLSYRQKRVPPGADTKALLAWNALLASGYCEAFRAFHAPDWKKKALDLGLLIKKHLFSPEGEPYHQFSGGAGRHLALADDYAHAIRCFLDLHEISGDPSWYNHALNLQRRAIDLFSDDEGLFFHMTPRGFERSAINPLETEDNVIPSSNAVMAKNLLDLGLLEGNTTWIQRAEKMTLHMTGHFERYPEGYYAWMQLYLRLSKEEKEWIIAGPEAGQWYLQLLPLLPPGTLMRWADQPGRLPWEKDRFDPSATKVYICTRGACQLPQTDLAQLIHQLKQP